jgi:hypothetical protein
VEWAAQLLRQFLVFFSAKQPFLFAGPGTIAAPPSLAMALPLFPVTATSQSF